jgi:hypothetical protein
MAKFASNFVLDGSLQVVSQATRLVALAGQPASYALANAGALAEAALTGADFQHFRWQRVGPQGGRGGQAGPAGAGRRDGGPCGAARRA